MLQNNFLNLKNKSNYTNLFYLELKKIKNIFETDGFENNFYLILMLRIKAKYNYRNGINPRISLEFKNFIHF